MKIIFLLSLVLVSSVSVASPIEQVMTIKERLRISLWVEGLQETTKQKSEAKSKNELPVELERALRKL